ncbi:hypothetical protein [Pseudochelatococcus sp. G4_1912]|uniref:hypothetical protein n=1 Tax=Pseudochelatococcus sp. G4_1912 TaxID=3114288 RepID=UPI0039C5DD76
MIIFSGSLASSNYNIVYASGALSYSKSNADNINSGRCGTSRVYDGTTAAAKLTDGVLAVCWAAIV